MKRERRADVLRSLRKERFTPLHFFFVVFSYIWCYTRDSPWTVVSGHLEPVCDVKTDFLGYAVDWIRMRTKSGSRDLYARHLLLPKMFLNSQDRLTVWRAGGVWTLNQERYPSWMMPIDRLADMEEKLRILEDLNMIYIRQIALSLKVKVFF